MSGTEFPCFPRETVLPPPLIGNPKRVFRNSLPNSQKRNQAFFRRPQVAAKISLGRLPKALGYSYERESSYSGYQGTVPSLAPKELALILAILDKESL